MFIKKLKLPSTEKTTNANNFFRVIASIINATTTESPRKKRLRFKSNNGSANILFSPSTSRKNYIYNSSLKRVFFIFIL